jgi:hypothetical protein
MKFALNIVRDEKRLPHVIAALLSGEKKEAILTRITGAVGAVLDAQGKPASLVNAWSKEQRNDVHKAFQEALRTLVDRWIDSGKDKGSESPWNRKLSFADREKIRQFWDNNRVGVDVGEDGSLQLRPEAERRFSAGDNRLRFMELLRRAEEVAIFWFSVLLDGGAPQRLMRCDSCSAHFARENAPRRGQVIKRGPYCQKCNQNGINRRVAAHRENRRKDKIELAAFYCLKWEERKRRTPRPQWIAEEMQRSGRLPVNSPLPTQKWVGRYTDEIEARAEEIRRAK